jgi:hypothetical protein
VKSLVQTIQRFRAQHPKAAKWIGIGLIVVGSTIVIYSLAVGILGVVGFGSAGVAKGELDFCHLATWMLTMETLQRALQQLSNPFTMALTPAGSSQPFSP